LRPARILLFAAALAAGGRAQAQQRPVVPACPAGHEGQYIVWNFAETSTLFNPGDIEEELRKIRQEAAEKLGGYQLVPPIEAHVCASPALQKKLETRDHLSDLGDFVLVGLSAKGKAFQVHIVPYIVNYSGQPTKGEPLELTKDWCSQDAAAPSANEYRSEVRAYVHTALALAEIRLLESGGDPCRARQAQFFLERALSAVSRRPVSKGADAAAIAQLQDYLEKKGRDLKPRIEAAAKRADRCGMSVEAARLSPSLLRTD